MNDIKFQTKINSEIGELEAVILHTPGPEVENMTPRSVERALYSDILNLSVALQEYEQLSMFLEKITKVYQVKDLLVKVLDNLAQRNSLIGKICLTENVNDYYDELMEMSSRTLANKLIEGLPARIDSLTSFLNDEYYALLPLYNFYFTRDASAVVGNNAVICRMANKIRVRESLIMEAVFNNNQYFTSNVVNTFEQQPHDRSILIEGGDILVIRDDILVVGNGMRTTSQEWTCSLTACRDLLRKARVIFLSSSCLPLRKALSTWIWSLPCLMWTSAWCSIPSYRVTPVTVQYRSPWITGRWKRYGVFRAC